MVKVNLIEQQWVKRAYSDENTTYLIDSEEDLSNYNEEEVRKVLKENNINCDKVDEVMFYQAYTRLFKENDKWYITYVKPYLD